MWEKEGEYQTIMEAELEYCAKRGWGMNNAAVEVFNNLMAGVRDGWFFKIRRKGLDELEFLRWAEELRLEIAPLGLYLEPGVFTMRKTKLIRGKSYAAPKKDVPVRLVQTFVLFVSNAEDCLGQLADCYHIARESRGQLFDVDATQLHEDQERAEAMLGSLLGIPDVVIEDYNQHRKTQMNYVCNSTAGFEKAMYDEHAWAKYLCWDLHDDPFDFMFDSVSRKAAQACHEAMLRFPRWHPNNTA